MKIKKKMKLDVVKLLSSVIGFYLMETNETLTKWDCEHLAMNLLNDGLINIKSLWKR